MKDTETRELYIRRNELCAAFTVSERTVFRWLREGCPCVRIGARGKGDARFKVSEVEAWLLRRMEIEKR